MGQIPNKTYTAPDGSVYRVEADGSITKIKSGRVQSIKSPSKYQITPDRKIYCIESDGSMSYLGNIEEIPLPILDFIMGEIEKKEYISSDKSIYRINNDSSITKNKNGHVQSKDYPPKYQIAPDGKTYRIKSDGSISDLSDTAKKNLPKQTKYRYSWVYFVVLVLLGLNLYNYKGKQIGTDHHIALYASSAYSDKYPNVNLCSTEAWEEYRSTHMRDTGVIAVIGEGHINKMKVSMECILFSDGTLVGRYRNSKGNTLDLNGYVESGTGDLRIRLGHKSTGTLSNWHLCSNQKESDTKNYVYDGKWGKKELPSKITFRKIAE